MILDLASISLYLRITQINMKKYLYGIVILCLSIFISCKKKKDDVTPAPSGGITADYYIQANIGGIVKTFQRNVDGYLNSAGGSLTSGSTGWAINQYTSGFAKYSLVSGNLTVANDNLTVGFNLNSQDAQQSDYNAFFVTGTKAYVPTTDDLNGVFIEWMDESGAIWSTTGGSQSGSVFTITTLGSTVLNGTNYNWVQATFNCTLYNGGSSKTVTAGKVKGLTSPYTP
jgi:hypothetical protein